MTFIHLHVHSNYSFKDSPLKIDDIIQAALAYNMPAVALTDHNNLCGAVRFYNAARKAGLKPLLGVEAAVEDGHITLLAMNETGYSELCRLISHMHLHGGGQCKLADIAAYKNLLVLSGCDKGYLLQALQQGRADDAVKRGKEFFGDRYYIELQHHKLPGDGVKIGRLLQLAKGHGVSCTATNNVHFLRPRDYMLWDILSAMRNNVVVGERKGVLSNSEYYFKSPKAMAALFENAQEAIYTTREIMERCNVALPARLRFPAFPVPADYTPGSYLRNLCLESMAVLCPGSQLALARLEHELRIIDIMGFNEYFLVVWDIVAFAKKRGIRCTGRGSAADSLVAYLLGITHVDPLRYNLLFERFLNPERQGMPDIDIDFDSQRRDEVINYVYRRYGENLVAMVCTVNTMGARSAVREITKALGFSSAQQSAISRRLPHCGAEDIEKAVSTLPELKGEFTDDAHYKTIFHCAREFAELPRHLGTHNGGLVLADRPLCELTPLQYATKGIVITQHDKDDVERLGLLKMDLLGLKILSIIEETVQLLARQGIYPDIDAIPLDDAPTYALLRSVRTIGLFQLESPGMRELLGRLQPTHFEDIIATISLFRPGPMQGDMIAPFIARRHGQEPVNYMHPVLEPVLKDTYGVIIYQEQVLQIAHALAGFSLGQADLLRRAMTKQRTPEEMAAIREHFLQGCRQKEIDDALASYIFDKIRSFAAYGFNKAHAASFGWLAYQTAYLKAHYAKEFLCATLNNYPCGFYPQQVIAREIKHMGMPLYLPDINKSAWDYTPEGDGIRIGMKQVAGMTAEYWRKIHQERIRCPFSSPVDFRKRVEIPDKVVGNLGEIGALGMPANEKSRQIRREMQVLGLTVTGHPLELCMAEYTPATAVAGLPGGIKVSVAGIVIIRQTPPTRSGKRIIFLTLQDETGLIDVTVFPDIQEVYAKTIYGSSALRVVGVVRKTGVCGFSVVAQEIYQIG